MTAIIIKNSNLTKSYSHFLKLGSRKYLVISIVMVAGRVDVDDQGRVSSAALAVGACSEVACRLPALEQALTGATFNSALGDLVRPEHFAGLSPMDDIRGSGDYRRQSAMVLTQRLLSELEGGA